LNSSEPEAVGGVRTGSGSDRMEDYPVATAPGSDSPRFEQFTQSFGCLRLPIAGGFLIITQPYIAELFMQDLTGENYPLGDEDRALFQKDGHILLRGVATAAELAAFQEAIRETAYRFNTERRKLEERDTYGKAFLQIMNLWRRDARVREFVFS